MAPRDRDPDAFPMPSSWLDEQGEDEENEEHTVGNQEERRYEPFHFFQLYNFGKTSFSFPICCILTISVFSKREYIAEVRVVERERANREMARQAELQHEMRQSVTAMEQMLESQQRIEQLQRSLAYLRELHSRMVCLNI